MSHRYNHHPRPWTIETDWTIEVRDANGVVVEKFMNRGDAQIFVATGKTTHDFAPSDRSERHCDVCGFHARFHSSELDPAGRAAPAVCCDCHESRPCGCDLIDEELDKLKDATRAMLKVYEHACLEQRLAIAIEALELISSVQCRGGIYDPVKWADDALAKIRGEVGDMDEEAGTSDRKPDDYPYPLNEGSTHWDGCWQAPKHHNCAVAKVDALEAEVRRLRGTLVCDVCLGSKDE